MKLLVTGAYGQLGKEIEKLMIHYRDWEFLITDVDNFDITIEKEVRHFLLDHKPDWIINCAAYTAVDQAESEPETAERRA